jgi:hypothetical protein
MIIVACIIIALSCILLLVRVKFAKISFHDELADYSPCVLYFRGSWHLCLILALIFICLGFRGSMVFPIKKACVLVATLLSFEHGVCHPYGLV